MAPIVPNSPMNITCDVCNQQASTVFCPSDEAALCDRCDQGVHCANKLASKHKRYALSHSMRQGSPLCDICQERRALFFCREDRAIICRECDLPIHAVNEYRQNHNRFLLTGVRISLSASSYGHKEDGVSRHGDDWQTFPPGKPVKTEIQTSSEHLETMACPMTFQDNHSNSASSISEHFTKTLPGWRVDDFLDPSHPPGYPPFHSEMGQPRVADAKCLSSNGRKGKHFS